MRGVARGIRREWRVPLRNTTGPGKPPQLVRRYKGSIRLGPGPCRTAESRVTSSSSTKNIPVRGAPRISPLSDAMVSVVPKDSSREKARKLQTPKACKPYEPGFSYDG